jgi:RNA polymerase sigma factor (sigma-70 family)
MATTYSPETQAKSERIPEKTDHSLIQAVQERTKLLKTGTDSNNWAIRLGDRAFSELLKRYNSWIWKQVNSFTGLDLDAAYSSALQGFERAIAKFDLSRGYALTTFATLVVQRSIQSLFRQEQKQAEKVAAAVANARLYYEDVFIDPDDQDEREEQIEALNSARENLELSPERIKEMRDSGMKYPEIGAFFRKSAGAVRMIYNRTFAASKKYLQPELELLKAQCL